MQLLQCDPSDRVALQAALLIANIARYDVPRPWASLLPGLAELSKIESSSDVVVKKRSLNALKFTFRALRSKRFFIPATNHLNIEIQRLGEEIDAERSQMFSSARALLSILRLEWEGNFAALMRDASTCLIRGPLAVLGLACIRELLILLFDIQEVKNDFDALMREGVEAAGLLAGPLFVDAAVIRSCDSPDSMQEQRKLFSKCWERLIQIALVSMDRHTIAFASHVPAWANLCVGMALLGMDANAVHSIRPKSRMLLTRFVARALIQPLYRIHSVGGDEDMSEAMYSVLPPESRQHRLEIFPTLHAAAESLDLIISEKDGRCSALVEAIVAKYIVLSPDELLEWDTDPEGFARQVDAETSPDADSPRPCGVALLECMLERSESTVANSLISLASTMQNQPINTESLLLREAVYRAVGECFPHLRSKVDFKAWYTSELRDILFASYGAIHGLSRRHMSILKARAIWLIGVCGDELSSDAWSEALALTVQHVGYSDHVVALMAVSAATALVAHVLEEQQFVSGPKDQQRLWLEGPEELGSLDDAGEDVVAQADAEFRVHLAAVEKEADNLLLACFQLMPRLAEAESMIRILQCITVMIELLGAEVKSHLSAIVGYLPRVWEMLQSRSGEETGALVRLFSSLLAMLAHLIGKLGVDAVNQPPVANVLLPLLQYSTDVRDPNVEALLDDGLKLWLAILQTTSELSSTLQELLHGRLVPLLERGKDGALPLRIVEAYVLLGGPSIVHSILAKISASISSALNRAKESLGPKPGPKPGGVVLGALSPDLAAEASAAASLLGVLERMYEHLPTELEDPFTAVVWFVGAEYGGGVLRFPARSTGVIESCLDSMYRLFWRNPHCFETLTHGDRATQDRILDRWIALGSLRDVGELFIPALGTIGRIRRHVAAVALCSLLVSDAAVGLRDEQRAAQSIVLGLKAVREQATLEADESRISDIQVDARQADQIVLKRLELNKKDFLRYMDSRDAVRAAIVHFASFAGRDHALAALEGIDPLYRQQGENMLSSALSEREAAAAVERMLQTNLT